MIKKLMTAVVGMGFVLATAVPAFAGNLSVYRTGNQSDVTARLDRVRQHVVTIQNSNALTQTVNSTVTTGNNEANKNTLDGVAFAGNVTGNETSQIELNTSNLDIDVSENVTCDNCTNNITVDTTGNESNVTATVNDTKSVTVTVQNSGNVNNLFTTTVNTGNNTANKNTGNGTAASGDASITHIISTKLNVLMLKLRM